jgi:spermidine/putrescine transport system ATP-binding protein
MQNDFDKLTFLGKTFACVDPKFEGSERVKVVIRPEDLVFAPPEKAKLSVQIQSVVFKVCIMSFWRSAADLHS